MARPQPKIRREDLKPGEILCEYCTGKCCRYFALPIETPENWDDFEHIRWYMVHGPISIFVEEGTWYLMVHNKCDHLLDDNRCGIYEKRPSICRSYTTENCEFEDDTCYEKLFETPEQIWEYAEAVLSPKSRPDWVPKEELLPSLPILSGSF
jgi:Fe-S-cluster containining protein